MRVLLALIDLLRGSTGPRRPSLDDYLKPLILVLIALLAGPEIFAAMELTAVLELLGATLFLLSFVVALRVFAGPALQSLKALLPCECSVPANPHLAGAMGRVSSRRAVVAGPCR